MNKVRGWSEECATAGLVSDLMDRHSRRHIKELLFFLNFLYAGGHLDVPKKGVFISSRSRNL